MEVVASLSQGQTAAAQCSLFTKKSVPVIFEPPCSSEVFLSETYGSGYESIDWNKMLIDIVSGFCENVQ